MGEAGENPALSPLFATLLIYQENQINQLIKNRKKRERRDMSKEYC